MPQSLHSSTDKPVTFLRIIQLVLPIMFSNMAVTIAGIVDIAFLGHYGDSFMIGGLALAGSVLLLILGSCNFLRAVGTGFFAQAYGNNDAKTMLYQLIRLLSLAIFLSLCVIIFNHHIHYFFVSLLSPNQAIQGAFTDYLLLRLYGVPAILVTYVLIGWLIAIQKMSAVFIVQVGMTVSNIIMSYYFVVVNDWGVWGAALGTVYADYIGLILSIFFVLYTRPFKLPVKVIAFNRLWTKKDIQEIMQHSFNFILRTLLLSASLLLFTDLSETFGTKQFAANTIIWQIFMVTVYLLDSFAYVAESLCGKAYGAKNPQLLKNIIHTITFFSYLCAIGIGLFLWLFIDLITPLMTRDIYIRSLVHQSALWLSLLPFIGLGCFLLDGIYIGLLQTRIMRNYLIISFIVYLLLHNMLVGQFGISGLWIGIMLFFFMRSLAVIHLPQFFNSHK